MKWRGDKICFDTFGTSHSREITITATGLPEHTVDKVAMETLLDRRRAKVTAYSTKRIEADVPVIMKDDDMFFRAEIRNTNVRSGDYNDLYGIPRPSHADYAAHLMDGRLDFSGGGEFSGRLTVLLCVLGSVAKEILRGKGVTVSAWASEIGGVHGATYKKGLTEEMLSCGEKGGWTPAKEEEMLSVIARAAENGDSVGGRVECAVMGLPGAVGGGKFGSLEGKISSALYVIPAVKAVEFGLGFDFASALGSEANDPLRIENGEVTIVKNDAGGINGGLSNGNPVTLGVAFRPTPSISKKQLSVDLVKKENREIEIKGRHDACIVPRAVPVVEAAVAIAVLDAMLEGKKL